jgi:methionine synthase I (cobalamin-dependent)
MSIDDLETERSEAELLRQQRESTRQSAELVRAAAELARTAAEQARVDSEAVRRGAVSELGATVAALTTLLERMERVEAMRRSAGREN